MIAPRNGVHIVAETDHYQLLDLDNDCLLYTSDAADE